MNKFTFLLFFILSLNFSLFSDDVVKEFYTAEEDIVTKSNVHFDDSSEAIKISNFDSIKDQCRSLNEIKILIHRLGKYIQSINDLEIENNEYFSNNSVSLLEKRELSLSLIKYIKLYKREHFINQSKKFDSIVYTFKYEKDTIDSAIKLYDYLIKRDSDLSKIDSGVIEDYVALFSEYVEQVENQLIQFTTIHNDLSSEDFESESFQYRKDIIVGRFEKLKSLRKYYNLVKMQYDSNELRPKWYENIF
ncbi:MAG: hypothetical protein H6622_13830 [Halobacteriovoraceae bacterium]|nr:hypothetical protein [Halobacteriovoraceae bacterium]